MIKAADHLVDVGPGAGKHGGQIVAAGTPEQVAALFAAGAVVCLLVLYVLFHGFYTVAPHQKAVVLRFGKFHATVEPGLRFCVPLVEAFAKGVPVLAYAASAASCAARKPEAALAAARKAVALVETTLESVRAPAHRSAMLGLLARLVALVEHPAQVGHAARRAHLV